MSLLSVLQFVTGIPLVLFLPGYLAARIFLKELEELEKIAMGFVFSIAIDIVVGLFLGYNKYMRDLTGGITAFNLWLYLNSICILLIVAWALKNKDEYQLVKGLFLNSKESVSKKQHDHPKK